MATLAEIRAKLQQSSQQNNGGGVGGITRFTPTGICPKAQRLQFVTCLTQIPITLFSGLNGQ